MNKMIILFLIVLTLGCQMTIPQNDDGIFLEGGQMLDLLVYGKAMDSKGNVYDIYMTPGYVTSTEKIKKHFKENYEVIILLVPPILFIPMWEIVGEKFLYDFTYEFCLYSFIAEPWVEEFKEANKIYKSGKFASNYAYGTAFFVGLARSIPWVPLSLTCASIGVAATVAAYPIVCVVAPICGISFLTGPPVYHSITYVYNTIVTPIACPFIGPLTPSRVDGKFIGIRYKPEKPRIITPEEIAEMEAKQKVLSTSFIPYNDSLLKLKYATEDAREDYYIKRLNEVYANTEYMKIRDKIGAKNFKELNELEKAYTRSRDLPRITPKPPIIDPVKDSQRELSKNINKK